MKFPLLRQILLLMFAISLFPGVAQSQDWPAFRGAEGLGSANPGGMLATAGNVDLKLRWKRDLGSGYSSVVVAGNRLITCYSDGEQDLVICLDKRTGNTLWVSTLGAAYVGENGSFNGPIATPLIFQERVYALDPSGVFVCLRLEDGAPVWGLHLVQDLAAEKPLYGFATSPIVVGETLILQTGIQEKSLAGIDPATGEIQWTSTNDTISSQTPVAMNFQGRSIVLAAGGKKLSGVDPESGQVLFEFEHQGGNGSAVVPVPLAGDAVVLTLDDLFSKAVKLRPGNGDQIEVSEYWQSPSIKNTYNVPALCNGNLFAYSTRILTCVEPESGASLWKSREPGDGFLITIDGHLIINTKQGSLHIAKADPAGFQELARMELFDDVCWSLPAYSDNAVFCRNLKEIACVEIVAAEIPGKLADADTPAVGPRFAAFLEQIQQTDDARTRSERVTRFLDSQEQFPVIEGDLVHFLYRGPGGDVALASDMFGARQERKMKRVPGTDLFYLALQLPPDQRANYVFFVDYQPQLDPRNPRTMTSTMYAGEMEFAVRLRGEKPLQMSWFGMSEWEQPGYLEQLPEELSGTLSNQSLESEQLSDTLPYEVYLPPGYDQETDHRYRVVYVFAPPEGRQRGQLEQAVDSIFASQESGVTPAILVFPQVPPSAVGQSALLQELLPAIDSQYRTIADRHGRTTVGFGFAAATAIGLATQHSDRFCGSAVYSPLVFDAEQAMLESALQELKHPMEYYIDWGRYDMFNPHENWDVRDIARDLFEACQKCDQAQVRGGMVNDSVDWSSWRNRYVEFLRVGDRR